MGRRGARPSRFAGAALLLSLLAAAPGTAIDYEPSSLARLLGSADLVVHGTVRRLGEETITASVRETLGEAPGPGTEIEIVRYALYSGGGGLAAYEPGQSFVWMLVWRAEAGIVGDRPRWHVMGAEGEGEIPAAEGCLFLRRSMVPGLPEEQRVLGGRERRVQHLGLRAFWQAAADYRRCFRWRPATAGAPARPEAICPPDEVAEMAGRSVLHRHLAEASER